MRPNVVELSSLYQTDSSGEMATKCKFPIDDTNSTVAHGMETADAFDQLLPTLVECFTIVLCGYLAGKLHMIEGNEIKGLSRFASEFSLPALIFLNLVTINLSHVDWSFVTGILVGKLAVFGLVAIVTLIIQRPCNLAMSGLYAIFCTQGNDFGLAYPIVASLYGRKYPYYPGYIYLIAPISLIILNPIGFLMMEIEKFRSSPSRDSIFLTRKDYNFRMIKMVTSVIWQVIINPNVFMTILGVVGNFLFRGHLPIVIMRILEVLSQAFESTVLFLLGFSILGTGSSLAGAGLVLPGVLLAVKMLASPLITRAAVQMLCVGKPDVEDLSNFGFIFGMVPTGPIVLLFATQYQLPTNVLAGTMVVCTLLTGPLMVVLSKMITMNISGVTAYATQMGSTLLVLAILGLIASVWVFIVIVCSRRWKQPLYSLILCLMSSQVLMSVGLLVWYCVDRESVVMAYLHLALITGGHLASRSWTAILAIAVVMLDKFAKRSTKLLQYSLIVGFSAPFIVILTFVLATGAVGHLQRERRDIPLFLYGRDEAIVATLVLGICFLITLVCLITYLRERSKVYATSHVPDIKVESADGESKSSTKDLVESTKLAVYKLRKLSETNAGTPSAPNPCAKCQKVLCTCQQLPEGRKEVGGCRLAKKIPFLFGPFRSETSLSLSSLNELLGSENEGVITTRDNEEVEKSSSNGEHGEEHTEKDETLRHIVHLILLFISLSVGLTVTVWKLVMQPPTGMFIAMEFLDVVLNFGQGMFAAVVFGTDIKFIITPLKEMIRRCFIWKTVELKPLQELNHETKRICQQFVTYHSKKCENDLSRDISLNQKTYYTCFHGNELIDWLINAGLASTRYESLQYGRHLLDGRIICHVDLRRHFHDGRELYRFITQPEVP